MKIAYLTSRYPLVSHTFIMREVLALRKLGVQVDTFTIRRPDNEEIPAAIDREESRRTYAILPARPMQLVLDHLRMLWSRPGGYLTALWTTLSCRAPGLRAGIWNLFYFAEAAVLASELRRRSIRHVHVHFANVPANVTMLASRMSGGTWSMTLHGLSDFQDPSPERLTEKIRSAALVICVSDFGRAQAMLHSEPAMWEKIHRVHCGIDPDGYVGPDGQQEDGNSRPIRLLNVARLAPEKGHCVLLRAIRRVLDQGIELVCTFVGGEGDCRSYQELAEELGITDRVAFVGAVGHDEIHRYYSNADIFVLPSFAEGLPVVLMEAMASRLPVIATQIMGVPELVESGVNGLLVPPGRIRPLADAISHLAEDSELRRQMGANGREKVCREFDVRLTGQELWRLLSKMKLGTSVQKRSRIAYVKAGELGA